VADIFRQIKIYTSGGPKAGCPIYSQVVPGFADISMIAAGLQGRTILPYPIAASLTFSQIRRKFQHFL
jgi:hypothetical protein